MSANVQNDRPVLDVRNLKTYFHTRDGVVRAVDGVSFTVAAGETVAVVGESGCGKSVTSLSILRLIASPPGRNEGGEILFRGEDLLKADEALMRKIRGNQISMIFQEPMTSLNPVLTIGSQIAEVMVLHQGLSKNEARKRTIDMLKLVKIPEAESRVDQFPHQLSGGMRQRVMIAMALACNPTLLIADEPTTALDVTIQAQILNLMRELRDRTGTSIILITHDLGVVAEMAEKVVVMYAGKKVEEADVKPLFALPLHPYTRGLMNSMPKLYETESKRLEEIPGVVPSLKEPIQGCAFAPRCTHASAKCREEEPMLEQKRPNHWVACWNSEQFIVGVQ